ncbi:hypothetical protein GCM10009753_77050 [Streptantibioticus ferralitis]
MHSSGAKCTEEAGTSGRTDSRIRSEDPPGSKERSSDTRPTSEQLPVSPSAVLSACWLSNVAAGDRDSAASVVTVLADTTAAGRAARIDKPRRVVLSPVGREVP